MKPTRITFAEIEAKRAALGITPNLFAETLGFGSPQTAWYRWRKSGASGRVRVLIETIFTPEWKPPRVSPFRATMRSYRFDRIDAGHSQTYITDETKRLVRALCNYRTRHPEISIEWDTLPDRVIVRRLT